MITMILTGGQSRRMGRDKASLPLGGKSMSLTLAERFAPLGEVAFSVNERGRFETGAFAELVDRYPGQGPLNGLVSALCGSGEDPVLLVATDMPGVTAEAARTLLDSLGEHDACLYENEPLFGVYRRRCLRLAEEQLQKGENAMRAFLARLDVRRLPLADAAIVANLNTPDEWARYRGEKEAL